jgi:hypothetical protein
MRLAFLVCCACATVLAQEASSGVELSATVSVLSAYSHQLSADPRDGAPFMGGIRAVLYPTWKLSEHWAVSAAVQVYSRPYFYDQFTTQGYGLKTDILQANLSYSRIWNDRSIVVRVGQLSSAFGSFLLRYDDAVNPLIDMPISYGYYYEGVSTLGLAGAQVDVTQGKLDARAQFVNSSAINPRAIYARDQYGNWAGGAGYTIKQGFRVGMSAYRGPYLDRAFPYYFPGEAKPRDLPATAVGVDAEWGWGHWNLNGEWQRFHLDYHAIPTYIEQVGYVEVRRILHPRWYVATRLGYETANAEPGHGVYEFAVGYRPSRFELVKLGYQIQRGPAIPGTLGNTLAVQLVTTVGPVSMSR